jgi:peptidoglycan/xylan/chitin deacetylase (PgdA/CDA1 family)
MQGKNPQKFQIIAFFLSIALIFIFGFLFFSNNFQIKDLAPKDDTQSTSIKNIEETVWKSRPQTQIAIPILLYHYVEVVQDKNDFKRENLNIHPATFDEQIKTLLDAGYIFIFPSELPAKIKKSGDQKYAILSFDDGYETFFTQTYPILKKHQVKSVNYIISNFIGNLNYMTQPQIQKLVEDGLVEIGSHTLSHADLTSVSLSEAERQIKESRINLESLFQIKVNSFCYPYGFYNPEIVEIVKNVGYTNAVTTKSGFSHTEDDLYVLTRIRPGYKTGEELLKIISN